MRRLTVFPFQSKSLQRRVLQLATFVLVLSLVTACTTQSRQIVTPTNPELEQTPTMASLRPTPPADWTTQWLRGYPCNPPCWEGIIPGQTTVTQTLELLQNNPLVTRATVKVSKLVPKQGYVFWDWFNDQPGGGAEFDALSSDKIIYAISPDFNESFELKDVISAYGEPTNVYAQAERNPDNSVSYSLRILYRDQGILLYQGGNSKPDLTPSMTFDQVLFFDPTPQTLSTVLENVTEHPEWLLPWQGIQDFGFYCKDSASGKLCGG